MTTLAFSEFTRIISIFLRFHAYIVTCKPLNILVDG